MKIQYIRYSGDEVTLSIKELEECLEELRAKYRSAEQKKDFDMMYYWFGQIDILKDILGIIKEQEQ